MDTKYVNRSCTKAKKKKDLTFPLFIQRLHQTEIKRKLEEFARRERIHKMKVFTKFFTNFIIFTKLKLALVMW